MNCIREWKHTVMFVILLSSKILFNTFDNVSINTFEDDIDEFNIK